MKVKNGFIVREVAGSQIVIAVGERAKEFSGIIRLNETGLFLWNCLSEETNVEKMVEALTSEYEVGKDEAQRDIGIFVKTLEDAGILEK